MKLVRWPVAAVTAYVIYKYTIGKKGKGENVFAALEPETAPEPEQPEPAAKPKPKRTRKPKNQQIG